MEVECQRIWAAMLSFLLFYLPLAGGGEEPVAAGVSIMARANASIAIFQVPFSRLQYPKPVALDGLVFDGDGIVSRSPYAIVAT